MMEILNSTFDWWYWIIIGLSLLIIELGIGTFFVLGLGAAALAVGIIDFMFETSFNTELFLWIVLSLLSIAAWFRWFRSPQTTESGQSNYRLDTLGCVVEPIAPHSRGKVKFDNPVLGNTLWHATAQTDISLTTRVKIVQINGQLIEVEPLQPNEEIHHGSV